MPKKKLSSNEKYKRKMLIRRITASSILAFVVILCVCLFTPIFGISEITVEGNNKVTSEEITQISGIKKGENIFRVNIKKAENILKENAYVEDVTVKRKFPAKIKIVINESLEDIIIDTPSEFIVTTISGRVLYKTLDVSELPIPIVKGFSVSEAEISQKIKTENTEKTTDDIEYIKCFYGSKYWSEIDEFDISDTSNFMMIMRSGMRVTFGTVDTIDALKRKIKMLDAIIPEIKPNERSYLDLTTDKGYFGDYTADEYENIKKLREDGELIKKLTEEEPETPKDADDDEASQPAS